MGNGNVDVGNQSTARESSLTATQPRVCIAMAQQCGSDRGNQSVPQKLLHLVGCRDPKARPERWVRPTPLPR